MREYSLVPNVTHVFMWNFFTKLFNPKQMFVVIQFYVKKYIMNHTCVIFGTRVSKGWALTYLWVVSN